MHVEDLGSCYDRIGGLLYFGRMLDKIRLKARDEGRSPDRWRWQWQPQP